MEDKSFIFHPFLDLAVPIFPGRFQPSIFGVLGLTSVFGMDTGVALKLLPPENLCTAKHLQKQPILRGFFICKDQPQINRKT